MPDRPADRPKFCAVGQNGLRIVSADGRVWTDAQTGKEGETYRAVAFGNGRLVAVGSYGGDNIFAASADGREWTHSKRDAHYAHYVRGLGFGGGEFLGLGGDPGSVGDGKPFVMRTADGVAWKDPAPIAGKNILRRVAWGNGRFVGVGDRGRRAASKDGLEWSDAPNAKAIDTLIDVAFGAGRFVGVGLHGLRTTSEDGLAWTERRTGEEGEHLNSVVWAGDRFVAVGAGVTFTSADGRRWDRPPNRYAPQVASYGHGRFVGTAWRGRLLHSPDGIAWEQTHVAEHPVEALCALTE